MDTVKTDCCSDTNEFEIADSYGDNRVRVEGNCPTCGAEEPLGTIIPEQRPEPEQRYFARCYTGGDPARRVNYHGWGPEPRQTMAEIRAWAVRGLEQTKMTFPKASAIVLGVDRHLDGSWSLIVAEPEHN